MSGGKQQTGLQNTLRKLMKGNISTVIALIVMAVIYVAIWYVLKYTTCGRRVFAVGGNPKAAQLAGIEAVILGGSGVGGRGQATGALFRTPLLSVPVNGMKA